MKHLTTYKRIKGSGYKWQRFPAWSAILILLLSLVLLVMAISPFFSTPDTELLNPVWGPGKQVIRVKVQAAELSEQDVIKNYIRSVFKEDYDKAMTLLGCENARLNPSAINDNSLVGGRGKDYGIFQINDQWNGITHEGKASQFLLDYRINTNIAYRLYIDNGSNFHAWTCGRKLGI